MQLQIRVGIQEHGYLIHQKYHYLDFQLLLQKHSMLEVIT